MCAFHNPAVDDEHEEARLPRLSMDVFEGLMSDLACGGTKMLDMTGHGEPLCHPEAIAMITCALQHGIRVTLKTNGSLLTETKVRQFVVLRLPRLHVSLNASTEETYAKIHPGTPPGRLAAIVGQLRRMSEYAQETGQTPVGVEISAVITRLNMGELPGLVEMAQAAKASDLALIVMAPTRGQPDLEPRPEDWPAIQEAIREVRRRAREMGINVLPRELERTAGETTTRSIYEHIPCYVGYEFTQILATGDVHFCANCMDPVGNLQTQRFQSIWMSESYCSMRKRAMALPQTKKPPGRCWCFQGCCHVPANVEVHRRLYGEAARRSIE
jgi:MoaA/NifB/PqqE/SkfB family radical SAM enzyme